jgi:PAS domain S-box-containing protein
MVENIDYQSIMRSAPDLYLIVSPDLKVVDASDAYLNATMVKREDIIGKHVFDAFPNNPADPKSSAAKNKFLQSAHCIFHSKIPHAMPIQKYDIRRPSAKGGQYEVRYWSPLNVPVLDAINNVQYLLHRVEDVTELDRIKQVGDASSKRFQLLIENIKDYAVIMLDTSGYITTWNSGAEQIFGYKRGEIIGKPITMLYSPDSNRALDELGVSKEKGRYEDQEWRLRKNGTKFWACVIMMPIYVKSSYEKKPQLIGYGQVIRDLTLQKEIDTVKSEFVSVVNHELRTPLTSIFGAIRLLLNWDKQSSDKNDHLLEIANANCDRLLQLINDILDFERLAVGGVKLNFQVIDLNPLIAYTMSINQMYSERYGVALIFVPLESDVQVNVDTNRLIQVVTNLISNAVKFSNQGAKVKVSLRRQKNSVRISVTNKGIGIPDSFKNKLFEQFFQADVSTTRSENGTGLGLAISKQIVERFGGSIKFKSIPNKDTTFYFDLPVV